MLGVTSLAVASAAPLARRSATPLGELEAGVTPKVERLQVAAILLTAGFASCTCLHVPERGTALPMVIYASQSGASTLDQGDGGGNPFASALIELLERPYLTYGELCSGLIARTKDKSCGLQMPDVPIPVDSTQPIFVPTPAPAKRVALVFAYSDYLDSNVESLPGADLDLDRVAAALRRAAFDVHTAANPARNDLDAALQALSKQSEFADVAVIYLTGHGFEHHGRVYLIPSDYPFDAGPRRLCDLAVCVPCLQRYLKARMANLVFFGGCRTYM
jgi:hypothetical protein